MARTSIATDNFNRASLGTSDWSQLNTAGAGDVQIAGSTQLRGQYGTQSGDNKATARWIGAGAFTDDQYASVKVAVTPYTYPLSSLGVCVRASGSGGTRTFYEAFIDGTNPNITTLSKWVNGTKTSLYTDSAITWAANDYISLEVEGSTLRVCKNGTAVGGSWTVIDTSITTGVPGVVCSNVGLYGDDWEGGSIGGGSLTLTPSLFTNTNTFYAPTVAPGAVDLTPSLFSNTNAFYSATVSLAGGAQSLTPGLFSNANAFYAATVARVPGFLTPVLKNNTRTILASETGVVCNVYNATTGALVVRKTGLTSDASGIVSVTDAAMAAGTTYSYEIVLTGARRLPVATA